MNFRARSSRSEQRRILAAPNGARFGLAVPNSGLESMEIQAGHKATEAGFEVRERVLSAVRRETDDRRVRALAQCLRDFPKQE